jgi:hypothetical protein
VASADLAAIQQPTLTPRGVSGTGHLAIGGGEMSTSDWLLGIGIDARIDAASGDNSRWAAGASALGGVKIARAPPGSCLAFAKISTTETTSACSLATHCSSCPAIDAWRDRRFVTTR